MAGHTCKVLRLGAPAPDLAALRARIADRIEREPLLSRRLDPDPAQPAWVPDPGFSVERHVLAVEGAAHSPEQLSSVVAALFEQRLDRDRPLWRIDVAGLSDGGAALIWRLHHSLADGTAAMRMARQLLADEDPEDAAAQPKGGSSPTAGTAAPAGHHADPQDERRRRGHLAGFIRREFAETVHDSPFDGRIGTRRSVAFARVPFAPLHDAAKRLGGATINDAVLAIVAGALREWIEHHHGALGTVRLRVPVSLHSEHDDAANRDSFFTLPVDLDEPDPVGRLAAIHSAAAERKQDHDAERLEHVLSALGSHHAAPLAALAKRLEASPRSFALCVSNVRGPQRSLRVHEAPVAAMHSIAEVGRRHGLRVAVVSYAGELGFGLCADPGIADDLEAMARGIEAQAQALIDAG